MQLFMLVFAAAAATHMNCSASHAYLTVSVHLTRFVLVGLTRAATRLWHFREAQMSKTPQARACCAALGSFASSRAAHWLHASDGGHGALRRMPLCRVLQPELPKGALEAAQARMPCGSCAQQQKTDVVENAGRG